MLGKLFTLAVPACFTASMALAQDAASLVERGAYLARIMDCGGCHTPRGADGTPIVEAGLSGGNLGFEIPGLGVFWPPNLTSSSEGLGNWSEADILGAVQGGVRPDGRVLAPAMPWQTYANLSPDDARALAAFLHALPAVDTPSFGHVDAAEDARAPFYRVTMPGG